MNTNSARHILGGILVIVLGMWYFSLADSAISSPQGYRDYADTDRRCSYSRASAPIDRKGIGLSD